MVRPDKGAGGGADAAAAFLGAAVRSAAPHLGPPSPVCELRMSMANGALAPGTRVLSPPALTPPRSNPLQEITFLPPGPPPNLLGAAAPSSTPAFAAAGSATTLVSRNRQGSAAAGVGGGCGASRPASSFGVRTIATMISDSISELVRLNFAADDLPGSPTHKSHQYRCAQIRGFKGPKLESLIDACACFFTSKLLAHGAGDHTTPCLLPCFMYTSPPFSPCIGLARWQLTPLTLRP